MRQKYAVEKRNEKQMELAVAAARTAKEIEQVVQLLESGQWYDMAKLPPSVHRGDITVFH